MITVARFSMPFEAQIARAKLESEGIPAFVADEHTVNAQWLYSNAMGGVRLQVPNSCVEKAQEILERDCSELLISQQGFDSPVCPSCGSKELEPQTKGKKMAFIVFLFFSFPLWPFQRQVKCLNCGEVTEYNT